MKIKLVCDPKKYNSIKKDIKDKKIEFVDSYPDLIIYDPNYKTDDLLGKNEKQELVILKPSDIFFIESFGHDVVAHTTKGLVTIREKLYEVESLFAEKGFLRIHKSYIINKEHIKSIKPTFNMKFIINMKNNEVLEVTRSYYYIFKECIGL